MIKDELQDLLSRISCAVMEDSLDRVALSQLLQTVIGLLQNVTERYDISMELHSFNRFLLRRFIGDDEQIQFWTGFYSYSALEYFIKHIVQPNLHHLHYWGSSNAENRDNDKRGPARALIPEDELFLSLIKLRRGAANKDLAERFDIHESSVSRIFVTWMKFLEAILLEIPIWMSRRKIKQKLPRVFQTFYSDVTIIIDCTEMELQRPSDFEAQAATYSEYKGRNTVKALVGISPSGVPTFISDLMEGRISDNEITQRSGLVERLEPGSVVMADRGWTNKEFLGRHGIRLITPSFLQGRKQLDLPSLTESVSIARVRIHVERYVCVVWHE